MAQALASSPHPHPSPTTQHFGGWQHSKSTCETARSHSEVGSQRARRGQSCSFITTLPKRTNQGPMRTTLIPSQGRASSDLINYIGLHLLMVPPPLNVATLGTKFPTHELLGIYYMSHKLCPNQSRYH
jgi:hypothetical protein